MKSSNNPREEEQKDDQRVHHEIAVQKAQVKDISKLKTLDELLKEPS